MSANSKAGISNAASINKERMSKVEVFFCENGKGVDAFLDRNGYVSREVRAVASHAIAAWMTQLSLIQPEKNTSRIDKS